MKRLNIVFYGELRKRYGDSFVLYADSINDAIRSLTIQIDGLKSYLEKKLFNVKVSNVDISEDQYKKGVHLFADDLTLEVTPIIAGGGKFGTFIAGAVLTAIGAVGMMTGGWGAPFLQMGVGLMLGGVAQMLVKQPKFDTKTEGIENSKSSLFTNLNNTIAQGQMLPRVYGEMRVGSCVVSIDAESYATGSANTEIKETEYPHYSLKKIEPVILKDKNGKPYNTDINCDSVKSALTEVIVEWKNTPEE